MKEEGMDVSMHKGKNAAVDLLKRADLIVVMEKFHRNVLLGMLPGIDTKIRTLKESEDIPDPIGKDIVEYRRVRDIIKEEVEDIFLDIFKKEKEA
jgi:protein-tyrosine phosphatase/ribose 5-phosphate isomerase B